MEEVWKEMVEFKGIFISSLGRIKRDKRILKAQFNGKSKIFKVGKFHYYIGLYVALYFVENPNNYRFYSYKNYNESDTDFKNIYWSKYRILSIEDLENFKSVENLKFKKLNGIFSDYDKYIIFENGSIINYNEGKFLKFQNSKKGYDICYLYNKESIKKNFSVHRLVAYMFCEGYKENLTINHVDGDKINNHYSNLEWCTNQENIAHAYKNSLNNNDRFKKRVRCIEFDIVFNSRTEACNFAGLKNRGALSCYLRGERNYAGIKDGVKLTWESID